MTWVKKDDAFPEHPKVATLSDAAYRLHDTAICWCSKWLTDGRIPSKIPASLTRAPGGDALRAVIDELVEARLWDEFEDGSWGIHDYLEYNPSAEEVEARKGQRTESGRLGGLASGQARRGTRGHDAGDPGPLAPAAPKRTRRPREAHGSAPAEANAEASAEAPAQAKTNPVPRSPIRTIPSGDVVAKDLSGCRETGQTSNDDGDQRQWDGERATRCPVTLEDRLPSGMLDELAGAHRVDVEVIRSTLREFVAYWTVGGGAGRTRANWPRVFRQRCHELARRGDLRTAAQDQRASPRGPRKRAVDPDYMARC